MHFNVTTASLPIRFSGKDFFLICSGLMYEFRAVCVGNQSMCLTKTISIPEASGTTNYHILLPHPKSCTLKDSKYATRATELDSNYYDVLVDSQA
jgi:hypothetical protein